MKVSVGDVRKADCGSCGGERNCDVRGHFCESGGDGHYDWSTDWFILQCRGCEHTFALTVKMNSEDFYYVEAPGGGHESEYEQVKDYWPALSGRPRPQWLYGKSIDADNAERLGDALFELYTALQNDLHMLAGIGIRTSFDIASEVLGIAPELSFQQKLDQLEIRGHISMRDLPRIKMLVDTGSASAHRGWKPSKRDLDVMMEVLEHFIHDSLVAPHRRAKLDEKALNVSLTVPKRPKSASGSIGAAMERDPADPHTAEPEAPQTDPV